MYVIKLLLRWFGCKIISNYLAAFLIQKINVQNILKVYTYRNKKIINLVVPTKLKREVVSILIMK
jgi:hypothetical protein